MLEKELGIAVGAHILILQMTINAKYVTTTHPIENLLENPNPFMIKK